MSVYSGDETVMFLRASLFKCLHLLWMHTGKFSQEGLDIKLSKTKLELQRNSKNQVALA